MGYPGVQDGRDSCTHAIDCTALDLAATMQKEITEAGVVAAVNAHGARGQGRGGGLGRGGAAPA